MLKIRDLTVSFRHYDGPFTRTWTPVLHSIDLDVRPGELLAVCGESGAGKSLLAGAVLDLLPATARVAGTVRWRGAHRRGRELRYIPQGVTAFDPTMTIGRFVGNDAALARFGLTDLAGAYPGELSGGQLRRALLATSVGEGTRLVVADEPTPGLHREAVDTALSYFAELRHAGVAVLVITHDLVAAARIADRMIILREGRMVADLPAADLPHTHGYPRALWDAQPAHDFWGDGRPGC